MMNLGTEKESASFVNILLLDRWKTPGIGAGRPPEYREDTH